MIDIDTIVGLGMIIGGTVATLGLVGSLCFVLCALGKWIWCL